MSHKSSTLRSPDIPLQICFNSAAGRSSSLVPAFLRWRKHCGFPLFTGLVRFQIHNAMSESDRRPPIARRVRLGQRTCKTTLAAQQLRLRATRSEPARRLPTYPTSLLEPFCDERSAFRHADVATGAGDQWPHTRLHVPRVARRTVPANVAGRLCAGSAGLRRGRSASKARSPAKRRVDVADGAPDTRLQNDSELPKGQR